MESLTSQQQKILEFIREAIEATGFPPTRAEIMQAFEFRSPNAAESHLRTLERKGAIELLRGSARGMSMRDAGILDGDLLAVHSTPEARSGQIVVARLHDEVTVKRFQRRGPVVELVAENPDFEPIVVDTRRDSLVIEGVAVGLVRSGRSL